MSHLSELIHDASPIAALADYLDSLDADARENEATSLSGADQRLLWEKAADSPRTRLSDFVPSKTADLKPVIHPGRNTIPPIRYFQFFQKRFTRPPGEKALLYGYNVSNASFIHPGYFVAYETDADPEWLEEGGVVIDYFRTPEGRVPASWPKIVPNSRGLQRFVYYQMRDFMRRVSAHVTIGRPMRDNTMIDFWFTLCRRETASGE